MAKLTRMQNDPQGMDMMVTNNNTKFALLLSLEWTISDQKFAIAMHM
jgi:hypothetical protein